MRGCLARDILSELGTSAVWQGRGQWSGDLATAPLSTSLVARLKLVQIQHEWLLRQVRMISVDAKRVMHRLDGPLCTYPPTEERFRRLNLAHCIHTHDAYKASGAQFIAAVLAVTFPLGLALQMLVKILATPREDTESFNNELRWLMPRLARHFDALEIDPLTFLAGHHLTAYSNLSIDVVVRVWDRWLVDMQNIVAVEVGPTRGELDRRHVRQCVHCYPLSIIVMAASGIVFLIASWASI